MPRLHYRGEWFYELSPTALSETEFETLLVHNADIIRPGNLIVPFKKTVYAGEDSGRPDLAIIAEDYRRWMIVEVEMIRHSLYRHVVPQILVFREASYGQTDAEYLLSKNSTLDYSKLQDMLRGEAPEVLVLVNKYDSEWAREIRRYGAHMMVFEIFRSELNRHIFSIDGELPRLEHGILTELSFGFLPRCLTVSAPAALDFRSGEKVPIFIGDQVTHWERFDTATECYLSPIGSMPIKPGQKYALLRMDNGHYSMRPLGS